VMQLLANVQHRTIKPLLQATIAPGTCLDTDAYDMYRIFPPHFATRRTISEGYLNSCSIM
jgi:hypothetical protein